jgi:hypothetical protein
VGLPLSTQSYNLGAQEVFYFSGKAWGLFWFPLFSLDRLVISAAYGMGADVGTQKSSTLY